jgi:hypothetical protein
MEKVIQRFRELFGGRSLPQKEAFYLNKSVVTIDWWLAWCNQWPDLYWARIRHFDDGSADVLFQDETKQYGFVDLESAEHFVAEDEFWRFRNLDDEDREFMEVPEGVGMIEPEWFDKTVKGFEFVGRY